MLYYLRQVLWQLWHRHSQTNMSRNVIVSIVTSEGVNNMYDVLSLLPVFLYNLIYYSCTLSPQFLWNPKFIFASTHFRHRPEGNHGRRDLLLVHRSLGSPHRYLQRPRLPNALHRILEGESQVLSYHLRSAGCFHQVPLLGKLDFTTHSKIHLGSPWILSSKAEGVSRLLICALLIYILVTKRASMLCKE